MERLKRIKELKAEQNNFHQQQILDEIIMYDGVEITVGFIIWHLELIINELNEQNREDCKKIVWLAEKFEQHDRLLKLMKDVLDDSKQVNILNK